MGPGTEKRRFACFIFPLQQNIAVKLYHHHFISLSFPLRIFLGFWIVDHLISNWFNWYKFVIWKDMSKWRNEIHVFQNSDHARQKRDEDKRQWSNLRSRKDVCIFLKKKRDVTTSNFTLNIVHIFGSYCINFVVTMTHGVAFSKKKKKQ
jgi:hypothetical protein